MPAGAQHNVKPYSKSVGLLGAVLLVAVLAMPVLPSKQGPDRQFFPETGHWVRWPFLDHFNVTGGLASYGFPITDDFVDSRTGLLVQYFEKGRLEWHPGNPEPFKVQLGLLGDELGKRTAPILISQIPVKGDPACEYFEATGHSLCMAFREYYHANGGLDRFGYPIGEFTIENNRVVQWFQRARMEWHPENDRGQEVQLAPLGLIYFDEMGLPADLKNPKGLRGVGDPTTALLGRGSVINPVATSQGSQTAFVFVVNQLGQPVGAAAVTLVVHYPEHNDVIVLPPTSAGGTTFATFTVPDVPPGHLVWMEFILAYEGVFSTTRTSFLVWY